MSDIFMATDGVYSLMRSVIAKWHPHLASVDKEIVIIMREKATASASLGSSKKGSAVMDLVVKQATGSGVKFVLEVPADTWQMLSDNDREALMDHLLCYCGVEYSEKDGEEKCFIKKPELVMFKAEVRRHGVWMDISEEDDRCDDILTKIEDKL